MKSFQFKDLWKGFLNKDERTSPSSPRLSVSSRSWSSRSSVCLLDDLDAPYHRGSISSTPTSVEGCVITWPISVMVVDDLTRRHITDQLIADDWTVAEFRFYLAPHLAKSACFTMIRAHDRWPIRLGYEQICYIRDCCYFIQGCWAVDIQIQASSTQPTLPKEKSFLRNARNGVDLPAPTPALWQSLAANKRSKKLDDGVTIRRTSTTSEKPLLSLKQTKTALSDIFHKIYYLQRSAPCNELDARTKNGLEECMVALNFWLKENKVTNILTDAELKILWCYISTAQSVNENRVICIGELVTCLSQLIDIVQKLLNNTPYRIKSKDENDVPSTAAPNPSPPNNDISHKEKIVEEETRIYELQPCPNESLKVLTEFDVVLSEYSDLLDHANDTPAPAVLHRKQNLGATFTFHQKQGSDCTIVNDFSQEVGTSNIDNEDCTVAAQAKMDDKNDEKDEVCQQNIDDKITLKSLFSSFGNKVQKDEIANDHKPCHIDVVVSKADSEGDEQETGPPSESGDNDLLSNLVTFIRTSSMRLKRTLNKDKEENNEENSSLEGGGTARTQEMGSDISTRNPKIILKDLKKEKETKFQDSKLKTKTSSASGEPCNPVLYGPLRRSESGPITLHNEAIEAKLPGDTNFNPNRTFPYRVHLRAEYNDSGFESSVGSVTRTPTRSKKKCIVPLSVISKVNAQSSEVEGQLRHENFQFREVDSPNDVLTYEAMLPALTDISDDDDDERAELFFGRFPLGKPHIPLKTEKDLYHTCTKTMEFSDSDDDALFALNELKHKSPGRGLDATSRSNSSGSSISRKELSGLLSRTGSDDITFTDEDVDIIISPFPEDTEDLQKLFSGSLGSVEMVCENTIEIERKFLTGRLVLWTPDYKQKIKKVFISRQKIGSITPENSVKLNQDKNGKWSICTSSDLNKESIKTTILLTAETDTERSESVSTTATSLLYDTEQYEAVLNSDEELYFNMREEMKNLDQDIDCTPNQDELPCSVIDYMNRDKCSND